MPNYTEKLNLEKPLANENYNIDIFNANADKIDEAIKEVSNKVENVEVPVESVNGKKGAVVLKAADIKTVDGKTLEEFKTSTNTQLDTITKQLNNYSSYASSKDAFGIYRRVDYKRPDGTLYMYSQLSGGTAPFYTQDFWGFYNDAGTSAIATKTWTITYDADGKIVSKVVV